MQFQINKIKSLFILLLISGSLYSSSYNSFGMLGYINTPSAFNNKESSLALILSRNIPDRKYMVTASPFDWLDANIFYADITNRRYGGGFAQTYKDKGFSFKITFPNKIMGHHAAIGINDIAGTGLYSSEYLVLSNEIKKFEYSIGLGWGEYETDINFKNPLTFIDDDFNKRSISFKDEGGTVDLNNYFSGKTTSIFFGSSYKVSDTVKLFLETDPTKYGEKIIHPEKKSHFNIGVEYHSKNISIKSSLIRGNKLQLQLSFEDNFLDFNPNPKKKTQKKISTPSELQIALSQHNIGLKEIRKTDEKIIVSARQNSYYNQYEVNDLIYFYTSQLKKDFVPSEIIVKQFYNGMETNSTAHKTLYGQATKKEIFTNSDYENSTPLYLLKENFPYIHTSFSPRIRNYIASREAMYHGGLFLENDTEIIINNGLFIKSNFKFSIYDNFSKLVIPPVDTYPAQVRSDLKDYYNNFEKGLTIGRLELNYLKSFDRKHFFRSSIGIFEEMFGGAGIDYVYHREGSLVSFFGESYFIKKRQPRMLFSFKDYSNKFLRVGTQIREPSSGVDFNLSYGEYLAGDVGYTFEAKKRFSNGVIFSAFFTRTDVSKELFGEGSFDKGIKVRFPIRSLFNRNKNLAFYEWHPLTKDPGALLLKSIDLQEVISRQRYY